MEEAVKIVPISDQHDVSKFDCGDERLNTWLQRRALGNHAEGYTKTYLAYVNDELVGYYALTLTAVANAEYFQPENTDAPKLIPNLLIGRLGVEKKHQGKGLGSALVLDAFDKILGVTEIAGGTAVIVELINKDLAPFYKKLGFLPMDGLFLKYYLPIATLKGAVSGDQKITETSKTKKKA